MYNRYIDLNPAMATIADAQYIIICFLLWLLSTLLLKALFKKPSLHLPPSPPALPVIGHLHLFTTPLAVSTQTLAKKHGPLLHLRLGASRMLLVSSAPVAAEIFKTQDLDFADRPSFAFADKLPYGNSGFFAAEYGDYWRFMKKVCMAELFAPRQLERSRAVRREEIGRFLHKVLEKCEWNDKKEKKDVVVLDMGAELMKLTNNTISRMAMSTSTCTDPEEDHGGGGGVDDEARKMGELIKKTQDLAVKVSFGDVLGPLKGLGFMIYGRKIIDVTMKYDEILEKMLMEHQERGKREGGLDREDRDLMDIILKLSEDDNAEITISRTQMKAFFLDIFLGGTKTSSEVMQWTMAELINHPHVFNKLREEIRSVVGSNRLVDESDVPRLPYLQAVVKETLRLYPPLPLVTRKNRRICNIQGFHIPQDTTVAINVYAIMRDPEFWENPNEFFPERFLSVNSTAKEEDHRSLENFSFVPFGGGRRRCPGSSLALNMIHATIGALVQCFDWEVVGGDQHREHGHDGNKAKVNMQIGGGISLAMAHPLLCIPVNVHFNPFTS